MKRVVVAGLVCGAAVLAAWLWSPGRGEQTARANPPPATSPAQAEPTYAAVAEPALTPASQPAVPATPVATTPAPPAPASVASAPLTGASLAPAPLAAEPANTEPGAVRSGEPGGRARLAIIIDDCGQWPQTERAFVALPFPLTLSVLPHVRFGSAIARDASAAGKGVMLHLPMQTISGRYPGPGTITTSMPDAAIRSELTSDLAELPEARGVNNHEGSLATQDPRVMRDIADVLASDGRFFIDSRTSNESVGEAVARGRGVPSAARSVFLDNVDDQAAVETQLREAVREALATGSAIAIGHPRPATLAAVRSLGPTFAAEGVDLTLASALVH